MNVDLLTIINNTEKEIVLKGSSSFTQDDCTAEWKISGKVANFSGSIKVTGKVEVAVNTRCARCLKPLKLPLEVDIDETVGDEGVQLDGTILDVDNIVKNNILVELPIRFLCKDDCKGICSQCGADLNITECDCEREQIDDRFAVLKKLLDSGNKPE